jgi:hypothetical protein
MFFIFECSFVMNLEISGIARLIINCIVSLTRKDRKRTMFYLLTVYLRALLLTPNRWHVGIIIT